MNSSGQFAIPKDRQPVRVHMGNDSVADGTVFLEFTRQDITMHDRLVLHLENANRFFPLATQEGQTEFICKDNVKLIEVEYPDTDDVTFSLKLVFKITANFTDGTRMSGELMVDAPKERSRLSDCLNMPGRFLS